MFNLKERHIVVVLILIGVLFLLFLSTRSPICVREGLDTFKYSRINDDNSSNVELGCQKNNEDTTELKSTYFMRTYYIGV